MKQAETIGNLVLQYNALRSVADISYGATNVGYLEVDSVREFWLANPDAGVEGKKLILVEVQSDAERKAFLAKSPD